MNKKNLSSFIKDIIKNQTTSVDSVVSNLYGTPLVGEQPTVTGASVAGTWKIHTLAVVDYQYSPDEIIGKLSTIDENDSPTLQSVNGVLAYNSLPGNSLATTIVDLQQATGVTITVEALNKQIAIYVDETIVRRGFSRLTVTVNLPAGKTPLNIVTVGSSSERVIVSLPYDLTFSIEAYIPPTPNWLDSGYINTNYVDPITGSTGMSLGWYNQDTVGGWDVYRVESQNYGVISGAASSANRFYFSIINSGTVPYISSVFKIENKLIGIVDGASSDGNNGLFLAVIPFNTNYDASVFSGTAYIVSYRTIGVINKNSTEAVIRFVDMNVKKGSSYSYTIDSFSPYDSSLRSSKASTISAVAGDIYPPGPIQLLSVSVDANKRLTVSYITPSDLDYYATQAIYYYQGSGAGQIANVEYHTDVGIASTQDSMVFPGITSGTFVFVTSDIVGNVQQISSGVAFYWNGSGQVGGGANTPPNISIAQLTTAQMSLDPKIWAQYTLTGSDIETPGSVIVQYKINSGTSDPWITAPSNPFTLTLGIKNRDGFVVARSFDGTYFSDEVTATADFDSTPEISSIYSRYIVSSGVMFINGAVDDDTKSLKWYIDAGADTGDPIITAPTLIDNLVSTKTFGFSFPISDGQRKIFKVDPFPNLGGTGSVGNSFRDEAIRLPRTSATVSDRTISGIVTKTDVQVNLNSSPLLPDAVIFNRVKPVENGTVTSGTANSISDTSKSWATNQFATYYDVEIVGGKGLNQRRNIVSGSTFIQSVSPAWTVNPDNTSEYYIAETYRHYSDAGKVTSATSNSLTDSTKSWIPNEFIGKDLIIYSGTGVGQTTTIVSGTITTQYFATALSPTPNSTSGYKITGPRNVARNPTENITMDFYSFVPNNGLTEEPKSLTIDNDTIPQISSGTLIETSPFIGTVSIFGADDDAKFWALWLRKNNWPTISSGSSTASLDSDYLRFSDMDISIGSVEQSLSTGFWYGIIVPYDSYTNPGPRTIFSGLIDGVVGAAALTSLNVDTFYVQAGDTFVTWHRVWWEHNSNAEKPGGNGTVTVKVFRKKVGEADYTEMTSGITRFGWQDSEDNDGQLNTDDTLNSLTGRGSWVQSYGIVSIFGHGTVFYRVDLYDNSVYVASYFTSVSV